MPQSDIGARGASSKPALCFVCSPNLGILDNWLPVLWELRRDRNDIELICVFPKSRLVDEIDLSSLLFSLAGSVFDEVVFRSRAGHWLSAPSFSEAKNLNKFGAVEAVAHGVTNRLQRWRPAALASSALRRPLRRALQRALQLLERQTNAKDAAVVHPETFLKPIRGVLYDVYEETHKYNRDVMKHLSGIPRFSLGHGIRVLVQTHPPLKKRDLAPTGQDVTAYLFSDLERPDYKDRYALTDSALRVVGVPRHERSWMKRIIDQSEDPGELGEGFVFVISRPANAHYFPRDRKRQAIEDIARVASELGMKIVVKLHPNEHPDGLYEDVFGRDAYGKGWVYSNLHPFVLGSKCAFAVTFHSGVAVDMLALGTPVIERLDLRGIPWLDHSEGLRDEQGEPISTYRYWGLVLGASNYSQLKRHADACIHDRERVMSQLGSRYRELFSAVQHPAAMIAQDVLASCSAGRRPAP